MRFSESNDDVRRASIRIEFRLSVKELGCVLANIVVRQGVQLHGYGYASTLDEIRDRFMAFTDVIPAIREFLGTYGDSSMEFDGDREILIWAIQQVETATSEKNREEI